MSVFLENYYQKVFWMSPVVTSILEIGLCELKEKVP